MTLSDSASSTPSFRSADRPTVIHFAGASCFPQSNVIQHGGALTAAASTSSRVTSLVRKFSKFNQRFNVLADSFLFKFNDNMTNVNPIDFLKKGFTEILKEI